MSRVSDADIELTQDHVYTDELVNTVDTFTTAYSEHWKLHANLVDGKVTIPEFAHCYANADKDKLLIFVPTANGGCAAVTQWILNATKPGGSNQYSGWMDCNILHGKKVVTFKEFMDRTESPYPSPSQGPILTAYIQ